MKTRRWFRFCDCVDNQPVKRTSQDVCAARGLTISSNQRLRTAEPTWSFFGRIAGELFSPESRVGYRPANGPIPRAIWPPWFMSGTEGSNPYLSATESRLSRFSSKGVFFSTYRCVARFEGPPEIGTGPQGNREWPNFLSFAEGRWTLRIRRSGEGLNQLL
jgi:hypothetical protein